ncbi:MAG: GlsB/YeaQ/YmgE family stress response membrane protein [Bacteroidales bacterium]|nr:GlsB/YeaQ/YmgE family stress response membrane protein [Bacteroidales bacterium]
MVLFGVTITFFVILMYLLIGALIGWIAGLLMKGKGFGFLGNIVIAILGSLLGGFISRILGIHMGSFITAVLGSILLLFLINLVSKKK